MMMAAFRVNSNSIKLLKFMIQGFQKFVYVGMIILINKFVYVGLIVLINKPRSVISEEQDGKY